MQLPSTQEEKIERIVEVQIGEGLHMRPAMEFVDLANGFGSQITVDDGEQCVDGKSIMQITMLAATKGTKLTIIAEGQDARQAADALAAMVENETTD